MALAEAMQLNPAHALIHQVGGREFLLIERYDRIFDSGGNRERLHQEDFCQALGAICARGWACQTTGQKADLGFGEILACDSASTSRGSQTWVCAT